MTCKDCIHYEVCKEYLIECAEHGEAERILNPCLKFKNEADYAEVKHGKWEYDHWCEFKCSICGHWSQTEPRGKEKYCPNCGAKMDGRSDT